MGKKRPTKAPSMKQGSDLLTIRIGTAGIGRMGFKAWIEEVDFIDRQDGDDDGTHDTPGEALAALARRIDRDLAAGGFRERMTVLREALDDEDRQ